MRRLAVVCAMGVSSAGLAAAEPVVLHDTDVVVDRVLVAGAEATVWVSGRGATGLFDGHPESGSAVDVKLGATVVAHGVTDAGGELVARFVVPRLAPGPLKLIVYRAGADPVERAVTIAERTHLHVRLDRPDYRPGQTLRWRVTALSAADAHPLGRAPVEVTVADPRGTAVWRGRVTTGATGMIAGEVPLADDLLLGEYTVKAEAGGATASEQAEVRAYVLPAFFVTVEQTHPGPLAAGARFEGQVAAHYPHGEPVAGKVALDVDAGDGTERRISGALDGFGRMAIDFEVKGEGGVDVAAAVTDGAERTARGRLAVPRVADDLAIAVVAAGQAVTVITTDGDGRFVPARVYLKVPGQARRLERASEGAVRFDVAVEEGARVVAGAVAADGRVARDEVEIRAGEGGRLLRLGEAVIRAGTKIEVRGRWPEAHGPVIATLLRHGAPLATAAARVDAGGELAVDLQPPEGTFGLATVRLTELAWNHETGELTPVVERATVYLTPASLDVRVQAPDRVRPGAAASLAVKVVDGAGRPAPGVGLAASVVDERVLALGAPRPDLPTVLASLDVERARQAGVAFSDLAREAGATARLALRAIVEALPPGHDEPMLRIAAAERLAAERKRVRELGDAVYPLLLVEPAALGTRDTWLVRLPEWLARARVADERRLTPWRSPTEWDYAQGLWPELGWDHLSLRVANQRLDLLEQRLYALRRIARPLRGDVLATLVARGLVGRHLATDPWGVAVRVTRDAGTDLASPGADGEWGTKDDLVRQDVFREFTAYGSIGHGSGTGVGYGVGAGSLGARRSRSPMLALGEEAAVRQRFDETVLWVAGVETDAAGQAELDLTLADSITGWQVDVEALGPHGASGAARGRIETFLPLAADADVPASLAVGDVYQVPVVVTRARGARAASLEVAVAAEGAVEVGGALRRKLALPEGAATAEPFELRAAREGEGRVQITLLDGGKAVDVVRRTLRVEPRGSLVRTVHPAALEGGAARIAFETGAPASGQLRVFRGAMDQAVDGLERLLREPHGCFEQTSSTTHPNLLVLSLLEGKTGHDEARARARELVAKGYQRLISFEVEGGGFDWFGHAPANQVLTAYGLLEFTDMAKVYPVDAALVERTRNWLLGKQRADGSWKPDESWLHDWSEVQGKLSTTAYIAWALSESGYRGPALARALGFLRRHEAELAKDTYLLGLWAAADRSALPLLQRHSAPDGMVAAGKRTLFYATGRGADVQVTALAAAALAKVGQAAKARQALRWLWSARDAWGTTQSTVLALRAAALAQPAATSGPVRVRVDGGEPRVLAMDGDGVPTLELAGLAAGPHQVQLAGEREAALDVDMRVEWRTPGEPVPVASGLKVALALPAEAAAVGERAKLHVDVSNPGKERVAMPTVVLPVPPGFRADASSFQRLAHRRNLIMKWEDLGTEVHVYLTALEPGQLATLEYELEAVAVCDVTQRPAEAYAYYSPEVRGSSAGGRLVATARRPAGERAAAEP